MSLVSVVSVFDGRGGNGLVDAVNCGCSALREWLEPGLKALRFLSTNAKKVTVSVLYWYEKLSSHNDWNFWNDSEKNQKTSFHLFIFRYRGGLPELARQSHTCTHSNAPARHSTQWRMKMVTVDGVVLAKMYAAPYWVRPYLVESTTSRPICEVKQLQA